MPKAGKNKEIIKFFFTSVRQSKLWIYRNIYFMEKLWSLYAQNKGTCKINEYMW